MQKGIMVRHDWLLSDSLRAVFPLGIKVNVYPDDLNEPESHLYLMVSLPHEDHRRFYVEASSVEITE